MFSYGIAACYGNASSLLLSRDHMETRHTMGSQETMTMGINGVAGINLGCGIISSREDCVSIRNDGTLMAYTDTHTEV